MDLIDIDNRIHEKLKEISEGLPRFGDGRIDYTDASTSVVLTCVVKHGDEILLLNRSDKVANYKGFWGCVAGYVDEFKTLKEKVLEELREEIGVSEDMIDSFVFSEHYEFTDDNEKTWIVYPVVVNLKERPEIELDWEHLDFKWILPEKIWNYKLLPKLGECIERVLRGG